MQTISAEWYGGKRQAIEWVFRLMFLVADCAGEMRIVLVSAVFPPEHGLSALMGAQTAAEFARRGHSVHVYAPFPSHPRGKLFDGFKRTLYSKSTVCPGCTLTHCFGTFSRSSTMMSRFVENLSFGVSSGLRILFGNRPDVIYSNSWPIFATGIVAVVAKLRQVPLVLRVQDVYPESLDSQRRVTRRNWVYHLLRQFDLMIARSCEQLLVISPGFERLYVNDRGVVAKKVHIVPNWSNDDFVDADTSAALAFRRKLGIPSDAFVAVYAGNVGVASNAEMLVDALAKLKGLTQIYLVIAGDGSQLGLCRDEAERQHLDRVIIHTPWKKEETGAVLQMADVLLLPTKGNQSLNSIPSKLISYLLSGRPVIAAVLPESDTATAILKSGAGWVIHPDSTDLMARTIAAASAHSKADLIRMGTSGRELARQSLTRDSNLPRIIDIVEKAAKVRNDLNRRHSGASLCL
jgi:glycosyltransferase involved in cell wall biosynthesis